MSELPTYIRLGFGHITAIGAIDHILFLLALAAIYRPADWRKALWVVSAFTVGHSITLALAVAGVATLPAAVIEFLIPVTIVATCIENILVRERETAPLRGRYRPMLAGAFGLVHGAGFANYLRDLFASDIAVPLLGFNIGIELGQIVVLVLAGIALLMTDAVIRSFAQVNLRCALRLRTMAVSAIVLVVAAGWAFERRPW